MDLYEAIQKSSDESLKKEFTQSVNLCCRCFALFSFESVAFSFNGGKDSTVLLHVIRASIAKMFHDAKEPDADAKALDALRKIHTVYFAAPNMFPDIAEFITDTEKQYGLNIKYFEGGFKKGLEDLLAHHRVKAIFMGQRLADPGAVHLEHFSPTDAGWPTIMRVNAILRWSYAHVWRFLRDYHLSYCRLYDEGYTSLGSQLDTSRNPLLRQADDTYLPAYTLADVSTERAGRASKPKPNAHSNSHHTPDLANCSSTSRTSFNGARTAGIIVISSEILSGKSLDNGFPFLCRQLRDLGVSVRRVVVVPPDAPSIAKKVKSFSSKFDFVFTCGGTGPTHDDVAVEGIANAFQVPIVQDRQIAQAIAEFYGSTFRRNHLRMAEVPQGSSVVPIPQVPFPAIIFRNIYLLPGSPKMLEQKFTAIQEHFRSEPFFSSKMRVTLCESSLDPLLRDVLSAYPGLDAFARPPDEATTNSTTDGAASRKDDCDAERVVVISLESKLRPVMEEARRYLLQRIPAHSIHGTDPES